MRSRNLEHSPSQSTADIKESINFRRTERKNLWPGSNMDPSRNHWEFSFIKDKYIFIFLTICCSCSYKPKKRRKVIHWNSNDFWSLGAAEQIANSCQHRWLFSVLRMEEVPKNKTKHAFYHLAKNYHQKWLQKRPKMPIRTEAQIEQTGTNVFGGSKNQRVVADATLTLLSLPS